MHAMFEIYEHIYLSNAILNRHKHSSHTHIHAEAKINTYMQYIQEI
jgi:hypothetical protein